MNSGSGTTTFFDLPPEVRGLVWRRARFLGARERVASASCVRPKLWLNGGRWTRYVAFRIGAAKQMLLKYEHYPGKAHDLLVVEFCDYSRLRALLMVAREHYEDEHYEDEHYEDEHYEGARLWLVLGYESTDQHCVKLTWESARPPPHFHYKPFRYNLRRRVMDKFSEWSAMDDVLVGGHGPSI